MSAYDVIVVGSGMAGLSAAIDLAVAGRRVLVVERLNAPGGKMREVMVHGRPIDSGPTVFTMRWVFDQLLDNAGTSLENWVGLKRSELLARHTWDEKEKARPLDLYADIERSADTIAGFAGVKEAEGYRRFCRDTKQIFDTLKLPFMASQKPNLFSLPLRVGLSNMGKLSKTRPFDTMWSALGGYFQDPRLCQLFGRYATYCGSSPFEAPATLMLVAHVEQDGVWTLQGGMHKLAIALRNIAETLGVEFRFNTPVSKITTQNGKVNGVLVPDNEFLPAKTVIANCDAAAIASGLLGPQVQPAVPLMDPCHRSLSAMTWSCDTQTDTFPLAHHNIFFSQNYRREFQELFQDRVLPNDPSVYVCAQDRDDKGLKMTSDKERLLILINAPANGDCVDFNHHIVEEAGKRTFDLLERCGLSLNTDPQNHQVTTPSDFNNLFPGSGGALYGRASHGWNASFQRPASRTKIPGLYLAGGSAHPGAGIPMATLSGRLAASAIFEDTPKSISISRRIGTLEAAQ